MEECGEAIKALNQKIEDLGLISENKQCVLLTHEGPADFATTWNRTEALEKGGDWKLGSEFMK